MNPSRSRSVKRQRTVQLSRSRSASMRPARRVTTVALPRSMRTTALASRNVGIGASTTTLLRTSFFYNATSAASGVWTGYLKPGSCFDPTGDLATIQPQMYDQFSAMYSRYKVNSAYVRIKIIGAQGGDNTTASFAWVAAGYPAVDATALATYQGAASQQYAKTTSGGFQFIGANSGAGAEGKYLTFRLNHNQVVGARSDTWDIGAPVTADPTTGQFMVLPLFIQANASVACKFVLEIDIFQNVTFSQKKNVVDA